MKTLFICLLTIMFSVQVQGQTVDKIMKNFSGAKNAESVNIGKTGWNFIKMATIGSDKSGFTKKISSVQVIDLSECAQDVKNKFAREVDDLNDDKYEVLLKAKDDEDEVLILSKMEKSKIRELIIIEKNDPTIVRLKGKFDLNDISAGTSFKL